MVASRHPFSWRFGGCLLVVLVSIASSITRPAAQVRAQEKQGEATTERSSPAALAQYSDAANLQNNQEFDLAIEAWNDFLRRFPDDPLRGRARHYLGVCHLQRKQYVEAADALAQVVAANEDSELLEDTYVNLGWAQYSHALSGEPAWFGKAEATFVALLQKFPNGKYADQALFYRGEALYRQDKRKEAAASYRRLVEEFPKSKHRADGLYALGVTYQELQEHARADKAFAQFLSEFADHPLSHEVRMRRAEAILQEGKPDEAGPMFAQVAKVKDFPSADYALLRQAYCAALLDKSQEAAELYARVVQQFPNSEHVPEATMAAGRAHYRCGSYDEAAKWFRRVLERGAPDAVEAAHWMCRIWIGKKQPAKAAETASQLLRETKEHPYLVHLQMDEADALYEMPKRRTDAFQRYVGIFEQHGDHELAPQALYNAAYAALDLRQFDDGIELAGRFVNRFPKDPLLADTLYVQAECQLLKGEFEEAERLYARLIADYGQHADVDTWRLRLGMATYSQDKFQATIDALTPVVANMGSAAAIAEGQFLLGLCHGKLHRHEEAVRALEASLAAAPQWRQADEALLALARSRQQLGQLDGATAALHRLMADFPQSVLLPRAQYRLAECTFAEQDFKTAGDLYGSIPERWPQSPLVPHSLYGQAWAHMQGKEFDKAIPPLSTLIAQYANHALVPSARHARAMCRQQTGDYEGGLADAEAFLESKPARNDRSNALYVRGLCESGLHQTEAAIKTFQRILDEDPKYDRADQVRYELGWAYQTAQHPDQALDQFRQLAQNHPTSRYAAEAHFHLGENAYARDDFEAALASYTQAQQSSPEADLGEKVIHKIGWANFQLDRFRPALEAFTQQMGLYPDGGLKKDGLFMRAECLFHLEDYPQAFSAYREAGAAGPTSETMAALTLLHGGQSAGQMKNWEESLKWLTRLVEKFPKSPYRPEAVYEQGWAFQNLARLDDAQRCFEQVAKSSRDQVGARAKFMLGELHFQRKQFDAAIREFLLLMYGFGGEDAPESVKPWQAKGGLEAGRCAAILAGQTNDRTQRGSYLANARKYLRYVMDTHPNTTEATLAEEQLKKYGN